MGDWYLDYVEQIRKRDEERDQAYQRREEMWRKQRRDQEQKERERYEERENTKRIVEEAVRKSTNEIKVDQQKLKAQEEEIARLKTKIKELEKKPL